MIHYLFFRNLFQESEDPGLLLWLGGSDLSGTWTWEASGAPFTWVRWAPGEPSGGNDHCIHMWDLGRDNWNDRPCDITGQSALCEILFDC